MVRGVFCLFYLGILQWPKLSLAHCCSTAFTANSRWSSAPSPAKLRVFHSGSTVKPRMLLLAGLVNPTHTPLSVESRTRVCCSSGVSSGLVCTIDQLPLQDIGPS
jgi:hypothetical protein